MTGTTYTMRTTRALLPVLTALCAALPTNAPAQTQEMDRALSVARAVERLATERTFWPGFVPLTIPLAVFTGERTFLFRHPAPPDGFLPMPGAQPSAFVLEGRHPAVTSNSSAEIGGTVTATLLADGRRATIPAPTLAAVAMHEAFHVFQRARHATWRGNEGNVFLYPVDDATVLSLRRLESAALQRALNAPDNAAAACWARVTLDYRRSRFAAMDTSFATYERRTELNEGLATYVQLLAEGRSTIAIPAAEFKPGEFRDRIYVTGPALAFVLDRLKPGWQALLDANDTMFVDQLLETADLPHTATCAMRADEITAIQTTAAQEAAGVVAARSARRQVFDTRPGWRVVVRAAQGQPLWPQGFDPLNVEQVDGGFLHTRFLRLGNDAGELRVIDEAGADVEGLTEGVGPHPLFNGVTTLMVAGFAEPQITAAGSEVTVRAPGFTAQFTSATVATSGTTVFIRIHPKS